MIIMLLLLGLAICVVTTAEAQHLAATDGQVLIDNQPVAKLQRFKARSATRTAESFLLRTPADKLLLTADPQYNMPALMPGKLTYKLRFVAQQRVVFVELDPERVDTELIGLLSDDQLLADYYVEELELEHYLEQQIRDAQGQLIYQRVARAGETTLAILEENVLQVGDQPVGTYLVAARRQGKVTCHFYLPSGVKVATATFDEAQRQPMTVLTYQDDITHTLPVVEATSDTDAFVHQAAVLSIGQWLATQRYL